MVETSAICIDQLSLMLPENAYSFVIWNMPRQLPSSYLPNIFFTIVRLTHPTVNNSTQSNAVDTASLNTSQDKAEKILHFLILRYHSGRYECCHLLGYSAVYPYVNRRSEESITSIFRVENQSNKKQDSSRWLGTWLVAAAAHHLPQLVSCSADSRSWRWRRYAPPKRCVTYGVHSAISQKIAILSSWDFLHRPLRIFYSIS
jgi:hypothetical protein